MAQQAPFSTTIQLTREKVHYRIEDKWIEFPISAIQVIDKTTAGYNDVDFSGILIHIAVCRCKRNSKLTF